MVKKERRKRPTSGESLANGLDRWDEEGGAPAVKWPLPYETVDLLALERRVLECLGVALVSEWNGLPTDVQRRLFEHAASGKSHDAALLKARIARFLHDHEGLWICANPWALSRRGEVARQKGQIESFLAERL